MAALPRMPRCAAVSHRVQGCIAAFTLYKRLAFFDGEKGDKEEAEVLIHSFEIGAMGAAIGAGPGLLFQFDGAGLHTPDKEKHIRPPILIIPQIPKQFSKNGQTRIIGAC